MPKKYILLKTLSQSIIFGILLSFIAGFISIFDGLLQSLNEFVFGYGFETGFLPASTYIIPATMIFGLVVGSVLIFPKIYPLKIPQICNLLALLIGFVMCILAFILPNSGDIRELLRWVCYDLAGFIFGILIVQVGSVFIKNGIIFLGIGILISLLLFLYPLDLTAIQHEPRLAFWFDSEIIKNCLFGFIIGSTLYQSLKTGIASIRTSWKTFILWIIIGSLLGSVTTLFFVNFNYWAYPFYTSIFFFLVAFIVVNDQGDKVIKQIKPHYKYLIKQNTLYPKINWKRLIFGLIVGISYLTFRQK